jgi:hypothetical protein
MILFIYHLIFVNDGNDGIYVMDVILLLYLIIVMFYDYLYLTYLILFYNL